MYQQQYFIPKESGTLTDTLIAFGMADLLDKVARQNMDEARITIKDMGSCFVIDTGHPIQEAWISQTGPIEQIPFLTSSKVSAPADIPMYTRDIDETWDEFRRYQEQRKQLSDKKVSGVELEHRLADVKPRDDWTVVTYLGDYRMQAQAIHNTLVEQWRRTSEVCLALNLQTLLSMFAGLDVDQTVIVAQWKKEVKALDLGSGFKETVTASQLFNPHMGKGQNRAKANGLAMSNEKNFWLLDYLKAVGLWTAAAPRNVTNADVRKTYILAPRQLALNSHSKIFGRFRDRLWNNTAIKLDIMAALLYVDVLVDHAVETENLGLFSRGPMQNLVAGMNVAGYQLLSKNSYTMMNLSFLGIPDWMLKIHSYSEAQECRQIIQEHIERINGIDEEKSEGHTLLLSYRNFISGNDLQQFFDFCGGYGNYLINALESKSYYVRPFSERNLRRLIEMNSPKLMPILQNPGFRNIADAIRRSTVIPQYIGRKSSTYDVRYGLGQELRRKAQYADDFVQELSAFMQSYNEENARVYEQKKGRLRGRKAIMTQDIEAMIGLIDEHGSEIVCNLLVAFGYARDPKDREKEAITDEGLISEDGTDEHQM